MKELVVISGKGGTGKTSVTACFAALAGPKVIADCDVDAADLHLVMDPEIRRREDFSGGSQARVRPEDCIACGKCAELCNFAAIDQTGPENSRGQVTFRVDPFRCEGCGVCVEFCPQSAIDFESVVNGEIYWSETRHGPMVHARLGIAEENSGKLVTRVRDEARKIAAERDLPLALIDGSPGVGCPVIASVTGADLVLIVAEPTLSGIHDLDRVGRLAGHFGVPALVSVNKWDINPELTERIENEAAERGLAVAGRVRYDPAVVKAQIERKSVVEYTSDGISDDMRQVWETVAARLE